MKRRRKAWSIWPSIKGCWSRRAWMFWSRCVMPIGGTDLDKLHEAVKREFLSLDEQEKSVRSVLAKMESGFIHRFMEFQHE